MILHQQYKAVKAGTLTKEQFIQEAKWDSVLAKYISNFDTFEDVVNNFKSKGLLFEDEEKAPVKFSMMNLKEALTDEINQCANTVNSEHVNAFEFEKGWRYELKAVGKYEPEDVKKAQQKAVKNIEKDAIYYTKIEMGDNVPEEKGHKDLDVSKGQNKVDDDNQPKPVKAKEVDSDAAAKEYLKKSEDKGKHPAKANLKEYAEGDEEVYDEMEDTYGTPEILAILKKLDYLGFDLPGEAINAILTDKNFDKSFDIPDPADVSKLKAWRAKYAVNESPLSDLVTSHQNDKHPLKEEDPQNKVPGGLGDKLTAADVDQKELAMGLTVEAEHTDDPEIALEIVLDHLSEDPLYYTHMKEAGLEEAVSGDAMKKLAGKSVEFSIQGKDYKKESVKAVIGSVKKSKDGSIVVSLKDKTEVVIPAKAKPGMLGVHVVKGETPKKIVDLGPGLTTIFSSKSEEEGVNEAVAKKPYRTKWPFYVVQNKSKLIAGFDNKNMATEFKAENPQKGLDVYPLDQIAKLPGAIDINKPEHWRNISTNNFMWMKEHALKEAIRAVVRKKLLKEYSQIPAQAGPDVDRAELKRLLKGVDWPEVGEPDVDQPVTTYRKEINQDKINGIKSLIDRMGQEGIDLYNEYAPEGCKWGEENDLFSMREESEEAVPQVRQDLKDMEDLDPKDLAKKVLDGEFAEGSVKNKAAALLLGNAIKNGDTDADVKKAFMKLSDALKK